MLFGIEWDTANNWVFAWSILPILLKGLVVTIQATLVGFLVALILGLVLAALKGARLRIISWPAYFITEFIRDTPLLVQLFFLYYVLPEYGIVLPAFMTGALALGLQYSAYTSEVYRAGLESIPHGQTEASRVLDFTPLHTFMFIILPQAIPRIIPALGNYLVSIMKDVPVLSVIAILEILNVARIIGDRTFNYLIPLSMVGGIYLLLTLLASAGIRYLDKRLPKEGIPLK
ncbi:ectoine/hydroxyectoine ABC transporter permease subunit EhuD [Advenella sp. WQ 585]|uniref:Ectoine/hydroxyectoine ABC transporter permease subunit EhuD n=1 Tax=Advenella mandrilli TaxID=2800330 RepID=A0ABS1EAI8_9BURK|nr:ectoine/hydroxyectoine ABC transporter permease subunit EhuD [Advenella mandrilli]MBK1780534.1 ectoine/hydroxyectoine ABC transporter permease subunit EhuD [Advenella mandrilli]